ncbi:hypothetical protein PTI45_03935 [Paenibacillus nuruki]|uniref:Ankyrin repeat protein n=2 Tax=Paenibacillus TaxID=44249 RepID=A0A1E3KYT3_9BACL|nr:hypothetical protein PTI45_03935 [Paenibacillus nuruki]
MWNSYVDQTQKEFLVDWIEHYILKSTSISWIEKGIFIYLLTGKSSKKDIYSSHVDTAFDISISLRKLMSNKFITYNKDSHKYDLVIDFSKTLFAFKLTQDDTLNSLMDDPDISYAAKGLITFISTYSNLQISIKSVLKYSSATELELMTIVNELIDAGYLYGNKHTVSLNSSFPSTNLSLIKSRIEQIYQDALKSQLILYLSDCNPNHFKGWSDLLYSRCYNLSILQIAIIASDNVSLYKLLDHNIITDYTPYDPLKIAYLFHNHSSLSILLGSSAITENSKNVYELFAKMIMDNQPFEYINYFLDLVDNKSRVSWISYLMMPAMYCKRYDLLKRLLEIGADPCQNVSSHQTLFDLAVRQEDVDAILLMKEYK